MESNNSQKLLYIDDNKLDKHVSGSIIDDQNLLSVFSSVSADELYLLNNIEIEGIYNHLSHFWFCIMCLGKRLLFYWKIFYFILAIESESRNAMESNNSEKLLYTEDDVLNKHVFGSITEDQNLLSVSSSVGDPYNIENEIGMYNFCLISKKN